MYKEQLLMIGALWSALIEQFAEDFYLTLLGVTPNVEEAFNFIIAALCVVIAASGLTILGMVVRDAVLYAAHYLWAFASWGSSRLAVGLYERFWLARIKEDHGNKLSITLARDSYGRDVCYEIADEDGVIGYIELSTLRVEARRLLTGGPSTLSTTLTTKEPPLPSLDEAMLAHSPLNKVPMRPNSACVVFWRGSEAVGNGFRYRNMIIAPAHVVASADTWGLPKDPRSQPAEDFKVFKGGLDLVYRDYPEKVFSYAGVGKSPRIMSVSPDATVTVLGYLPKQQCWGQATGSVREEAGNWCVSYTASTLPGMSGCMVLKGDKLVGIHLRRGECGTQNVFLCLAWLGLEMRHLDAVLGLARNESVQDLDESVGSSSSARGSHIYHEVLDKLSFKQRRALEESAEYEVDGPAGDDELDKRRRFFLAHREEFEEWAPYEQAEYLSGYDLAGHGSSAVNALFRRYENQNESAAPAPTDAVPPPDTEDFPPGPVPHSGTATGGPGENSGKTPSQTLKTTPSEGSTNAQATTEPMKGSVALVSAPKGEDLLLKLLDEVQQLKNSLSSLQKSSKKSSTTPSPPPGGEGRAYSKHVSRSRVFPLNADSVEKASRKVAEQRKGIQLTPEHTALGGDLSLRTLRRHVLDAKCRVDLSKNPGYPLNIGCATNSAAFKQCREEIICAAVYRLRLMLDPEFDFESHMDDPFYAVTQGLYDPSTVFIKNEPHPSRKVKEGRYRCITPVSLVDQMVEGCLFGEYSRLIQDRIYVSGSAVGIGFTDTMLERLRTFIFEDCGGSLHGVTSDDVSGFDGLHSQQALDATVRIDELTDCGTSQWNRANARWTLVCSRSVAVLGRSLFVKESYGMLNSGSKDTSRRNTLLRLFYTFYLLTETGQEVVHTVANGDDNVTVGMTDPVAYQRAAVNCGIKLRDVTSSDEKFEFCSHLYRKDRVGAELTSWAKGVHRLLHREVPREDALQLLSECRYNKEYTQILQLIELQESGRALGGGARNHQN